MTSPAMRMAEAASNLIASLDAGQHARACLPFDDHTERTTWYYFPNAQSGLPFAEMTHWQQKLAHRLLLSGLSRQAYSRACQVMTLDNTLDVQEEFAAADFRDAALYYTTIFGQPGNGSWGWRFQGHHVCVNYTVAADGVISGTPLFLGANPARLQHNGRDYSRPFADTEELGRELFASLSGEARATALISERSPGDFVLANLPTRMRSRSKPGVSTCPTVAPSVALSARSVTTNAPCASASPTTQTPLPGSQAACSRPASEISSAASWTTTPIASPKASHGLACTTWTNSTSPGRAAQTKANATTTASTARRC